MERKNKIIISSLLVATMGISGTIMAQNDIRLGLDKKVEEEISAYNYNATNILENTFKQDGNNIVPIIYKTGGETETITNKKIEEQFKAKGLTIKNISTNEIVTGTKITTDQGEYTIVIYGDVDGDGLVDSFDAQAILMHYVFGGKYELKDIYKIAANVDNEDGEIDVFDAQRILGFYVGNEKELVVKPPVSLKEKDKEAPVITLKGNNPQYISVGESYIEAGANVTDNLDKNVQVKIDSSKVNTKVAGTYTVTYNATDANGNKANQVTRTVIVKPIVEKPSVYVTGIEIETEPTKKVYNSDENIDITGIKVNLVWSNGNKEDITSKIIVETEKATTDEKVYVSYKTTETIDGKEAEFKASYNIDIITSVVEYATGIEIETEPTKKVYNSDENIDITGIKVNLVWSNGNKEDITSKITLLTKKATNRKVYVSYKTTETIDGKETEFKASYNIDIITSVVEYATGIEIETEPSKKEYKYNENIDITGIKVNLVWSNGNKEDITSKIIVETEKATTDEKVYVSYKTTETINGVETEFTASYSIMVTNYITGLRVEQSEIKTYVEGDEIKTDGIVVWAEHAFGEARDVTASIIIDETTATFGNNTIGFKYKTTATIDGLEKEYSEEFQVKVVKKLSKIRLTKTKNSSYRYENVDVVSIESGVDEEAITTGKLVAEIVYGDGDNAENVGTNTNYIEWNIVPATDGSSSLILNATAKKAGTYHITLSPDVAGATKQTIDFIVSENPVVNAVDVENGNTIKVLETEDPEKPRTVEVPITFKHEYTDAEGTLIESTQINDVPANKITLKPDEGIEAKLLYQAGDSYGAATGEHAGQSVVAIQIYGNEVVTGNITIEVAGKEVGKIPVNIIERKVTLSLGSQNITLYNKNPKNEDPNNEDKIKEIDEFVYTLVEITDIQENTVVEGENVSILSKITDKELADQLKADNVTTIVFTEDGKRYLGISAESTEIDAEEGIFEIQKDDLEKLNDSPLTFTYDGGTATLNVTAEFILSKISIINVTEIHNNNITNYRYESVDIASVISGRNEKPITFNNLTYEVSYKATTDATTTEDVTDNAEYIEFEPSPATDGTDSLIIYATAKKAGIYTIIPKVGEIKAKKPIVFTAYENPEVNAIDVENGNTIKVLETEDPEKPRTIEVPITFKHEYTDAEGTLIESTQINDVPANKITLKPDEGIEAKPLYQAGDSYGLATEENEGQDVVAIQIYGNEVVTGNIIVEVAGKEVGKIPVNIIERKVTLSLGSQNITLYNKNPNNGDKIKEDYELVYTLVEITDIQENTVEGENVSILSTITDEELGDQLQANNVTTIVFTEGGKRYLGISAESTEIDAEEGIFEILKDDLEKLDNLPLTFTYDGGTATLNVTTTWVNE